MVGVYILIAFLVWLFFKYVHFQEKMKVFRNAKPGDKLVASYIGGRCKGVKVIAKEDNRILLSHKNHWMGPEEFCFYDNAEYFTYEDWYSVHYIG